ncbi:alpha/beta hydrolase family protein [Leptospira ryugenii]|uniref:Alpha/beta hydrolase family protein n=1 Tax=Leptospira ryugenii TaxID=1917863 RepID=A0A2P2DZQ7_9LEPT|nr:PHB depolymerase family esterase [Leptospira ryugenii]GBF50100.1 alpha/beta hydrolase family protein [Leptospira ryugenii]
MKTCTWSILMICILFHCKSFFSPLSNYEREGKILVDGQTRTYLMHTPKEGYKMPLPLVVALHGRLGTGSILRKQSRLDELADEKKFIAVFPDGLQRSWADGRGNSPSDRNQVNDVLFIETLVKELVAEGIVDPKSVFLMGHSNGGFMAQRLALERPKLFRAVVSVSSQLSAFLVERKKQIAFHAISIGIMAGTEDPIVPYNGGYVNDGGEILGVEDSIDRWLEWNQCDKKAIARSESIQDEGIQYSIDEFLYTQCTAETKVKLFRLQSFGHAFPGEKPFFPVRILGNYSQKINGTRLIWEYFSSFLPKPPV